MTVKGDTEIRHLPLDIKEKLSSYLDYDDTWKTVAKYITFPDDKSVPLFESKHITMIDKTSKSQRTSATGLMLNEWGTFGRKRPTIDDLVNLLCECKFFQAADYVAVDVLNGSPVDTGEISTTEIAHNVHDSSDYTEPSFPVNPRVKCVAYEELYAWTDDFNENPLSEGGRLLGNGAFSTVFLGVDADNGMKYALKCVGKDHSSQWKTELSVLSKLVHKNVLQLIGYSEGSKNYCLIFEYAVNGSLHDRLQLCNRQPALPWFTRLTIALGLAHGLVVVHSAGFIHRDVKSANVMLGEYMEPKLGDFGLAHDSPKRDVSHLVTKHSAGTSVYMPREAHFGIITFEWDTYSFGVVLLELLSGKKPFDRQTTTDLVSFFEEQCKSVEQLPPFLDANAFWNLTIASEIFKLSQTCLINKREHRPGMFAIVPQLEKLTKQAYHLLNEQS